MTLVITSDDESFNPSLCKCNICQSYSIINDEWDDFIPSTRLQLRMKQVIKKIEKRYKNRANRVCKK